MVKKRSVGVIVVGIAIIFLNLMVLLSLNSAYERDNVFYGKFNILSLVEIIIFLTFTTFFAIRLFYLKEYARKGIIVFMYLGILSDIIRAIVRQFQISQMHIAVEYVATQTTRLISLIIALAIYMLIINYLTRPKVKEQFKRIKTI